MGEDRVFSDAHVRHDCGTVSAVWAYPVLRETVDTCVGFL